MCTYSSVPRVPHTTAEYLIFNRLLPTKFHLRGGTNGIAAYFVHGRTKNVSEVWSMECLRTESRLLLVTTSPGQLCYGYTYSSTEIRPIFAREK